MLIGTFDFYLFIRLPVTLTLAGGYKLRRNQTSVGFIPLCTFLMNEMNFGEVKAIQVEDPGSAFE